jgi:hypothetical protein
MIVTGDIEKALPWAVATMDDDDDIDTLVEGISELHHWIQQERTFRSQGTCLTAH